MCARARAGFLRVCVRQQLTADAVMLRLAWDGQTVSCHSLILCSLFFSSASCLPTDINCRIFLSHFLCLEVFDWHERERRKEGKSAMPES